jgi:hypothetical protein
MMILNGIRKHKQSLTRLTGELFDWEAVNALFALPIRDEKKECSVKQTLFCSRKKERHLPGGAGKLCSTYKSLRNEFLGRDCLAQDGITGRAVRKFHKNYR